MANDHDAAYALFLHNMEVKDLEEQQRQLNTDAALAQALRVLDAEIFPNPSQNMERHGLALIATVQYNQRNNNVQANQRRNGPRTQSSKIKKKKPRKVTITKLSRKKRYNDCPVCSDEYKTKTVVKLNCCGYEMCRQCYLKWRKHTGGKNSSCPHCRQGPLPVYK